MFWKITSTGLCKSQGALNLLMLLIKRFWHPVNILPVPKPIGIVDVGAAYMQCSEAVLNENHGLFVRMRRINCSSHMLEHGVRLFEKKQNLIQGYLHSLICRKIVLSAQCSVLSAPKCFRPSANMKLTDSYASQFNALLLNTSIT